MNDLKHFYKLKKLILENYQKSYPFFQGDWKSFSSRDIRQLIDLMEIQLKETVSEKWIYTHLKPESNQKLPRKDMLDIFSRFVGYSNWDEFIYKNQTEKNFKTISKASSKGKYIKELFLILLISLTGFGVYSLTVKEDKPKAIKIKNALTNEPISSEDIQVYKVQDEVETPIETEDSKIEIQKSDEKIVVESPYFETKEVNVSKIKDEILLKPEDYAMVLKNFIQSDLKEWEDRKEKLDKILSDDLEVIVMLKNNLGAEHLNKNEFAGKLIIPTSETKKMKVLTLKTNDQKQITFLRIQQL